MFSFCSFICHDPTSCFCLFSDQSSQSPTSSISPCSESRVTQFIRQYVASCLLVSDSNTELSYVLPSEAVKKGCFERLFQVGLHINIFRPLERHNLISVKSLLNWIWSIHWWAHMLVYFLQALEQSLDSLALTSFGVMDTTLEEVFLKVSEEDLSLENSDAG